MSRSLERLRRLLEELKRRNVYKVAATYLVAAFVVLQVAGLAADAFGFPGWFEPMVWVVAGLGLPLALTVAWAFEMSPEGVRRTPEAEPAGDAEEAEETRAGVAAGYKALVALGLVAAAVAGGWYLTGGGGKSVAVSEGSVAVLPFEVTGSGAEDWRDGMVTLLNTGLDGVSGLRAIADRTVFSAWERSGRAGGGASTQEALAVAREVGAEYALVGSAVQVSGELRFVADVHDTRSGDRLGQAVVRGSPDSVMALTDSLTRRVLAILLEESGEGLPSVDLASVTTESLAALKSFLAGERHLRAGEYEAAIEDYQAAVGADSTFALAYLRLGRAQSWGGHREARVRSWKRARELSDRLPPRERGVARASYLRAQNRMAAAADTLRRVIDEFPDDPILWYNLGEVLWHGFVPRGWPEADRAFARAVELDPGNAIYYPHHAQLGIAVRHDSALAAERIADMPSEEWREAFRIPLDLAFGTPAGRRDALARLDTIPLTQLDGLGTWFSLEHPADRDDLEAMLERLAGRERSQELIGAGLEFRLAANSFLQGQVREGVARLPTGLAGCVLPYVTSLGIPVLDSIASAPVDPSALPEDASATRLRCAALGLVQQGRTEEADQVIARLRQGAGTGDSVPPRLQSDIDEVEGYRAMKAGDLQEAARRLSVGTPANTWVGGIGAFWQGELHRELGQLQRAEDFYFAAWTLPVAHERLGRLYEEMGEPEKAVDAYRRFVAAWEDADPELQDRVEAARTRIRELTGSEAEADG